MSSQKWRPTYQLSVAIILIKLDLGGGDTGKTVQEEEHPGANIFYVFFFLTKKGEHVDLQ